MMEWPLADDKPIWDILLSVVHAPAVSAASQEGIFESLHGAPASAGELADRMGLNHRAVRAVLPMLSALGLLTQQAGRYRLSDTAQEYLRSGQPYFWGPVLSRNVDFTPLHDQLVAQLHAPAETTRIDVLTDRETDVWSTGQIDADTARLIANYMESTSLAGSLVAARQLDLSGTRSLLDVGSGSGCFSIAFAQANPHLRCTLMDLPAMCDHAMGLAHARGVGDRVATAPADMFRMDWPTGHDALFFSNIFHDWDFETCVALARKAFDALPSGGHIHLHEALLDDTHDGPATTVAFSVFMLLGNKGQQFTAGELDMIVREAGFGPTRIVPAHGYYSLVSAMKP